MIYHYFFGASLRIETITMISDLEQQSQRDVRKRIPETREDFRIVELSREKIFVS